MAERILMIEDDERLAAMLAEYLGAAGLEVTTCRDGASGLARAARGGIDALILDVMLPDLDGFEVCRRVRAGSDLPILMLTARGEETDRIVGLELGADDYLAKPFSPRELLARLRAILRRRAAPARGSAPALRPARDRPRCAQPQARRRAAHAHQPPVRAALGAGAARRARALARAADGARARANRSRRSTAASTSTSRASAPRSRTIPLIRGAFSPCAARATSSRAARKTGRRADATALSPDLRRLPRDPAALRRDRVARLVARAPRRRRASLLDGVAGVFAELLPGPGAPRAELEQALQTLASDFSADIELRGPDGARLASVGEALPAPPADQRASGIPACARGPPGGGAAAPRRALAGGAASATASTGSAGCC